MTTQTIKDLIEEIESEFEVEIEVTGGGRGWTATADGEDLSCKAESKGMALALLRNTLQDRADEGESEIDESVEGCAAECQTSESAYCQCNCAGQNHGALVNPDQIVVVIGQKRCACGECDLTTKRTYAPGHDATHSAKLALIAWAKAAGITDLDEARKAKRAAQRKAARDRRAVRRAGGDVEAITAKAEAIAASA